MVEKGFGFGGLARDAAVSSNCPSTMLPNIAEAMALRKTMVFSKKLDFTNVLFEGDCLQVVNAVNGRLPTHGALGPILYDILQLLQSELNWNASYVSKELNIGADSLTNFACITKIGTVWMEDSSSCIEHIV